MPALDDYSAPCALWLVVCRVLDENPRGLSVTRIFTEVQRLTCGRYSRPASVSAVLARMREDGICQEHTETRGTAVKVHVQVLTAEGKHTYQEGMELVRRSLGIGEENHEKAQWPRKRNRQR